MTNLPIGRVLAAEQRVDHRVLEMRASPPGDKGVGISLPAFRLQKGFCYLGKPRLHVYDRSILIEHTNLDRVFENVSNLHGQVAPSCIRPAYSD